MDNHGLKVRKKMLWTDIQLKLCAFTLEHTVFFKPRNKGAIPELTRLNYCGDVHTHGEL